MVTIDTLKEFTRNQYARPGGYPMFALCADGGVLSHKAVKDNYRLIRESMRDSNDKQWQIVAIDINWEDAELYCDHTGELIESAYGE